MDNEQERLASTISKCVNLRVFIWDSDSICTNCGIEAKYHIEWSDEE